MEIGHYAKLDEQTTWKWQGWNHPLIAPIITHSVQVHHFKWDKTSIERIKSVADINQEYAFSKEYQLMYNELKKTNFKVHGYYIICAIDLLQEIIELLDSIF